MVRQTSKLPPEAADFVVNSWIGFDGNSLAHFSHRELTEFFRRYTDLPDSHPGVTNDATPLGGYGTPKHTRMREALDHASPHQQVGILKAVLRRLPVAPAAHRTQEGAHRILGWIHDLEQSMKAGNVDVDGEKAPIPVVAREALSAARDHMERNDYPLALDRIHTAIHACVRRLAQEVGTDVSAKKGLQEEFAEVRRRHPAFQVAQGDKVTASILRGATRILEGMNIGRNDHSLAHPTDELLDDPEARLFCNAGMSVLQYILDRVEGHEPTVPRPASPTQIKSESNALFDPFKSSDDLSGTGPTDAARSDLPWDDPGPFGDPEPAFELEEGGWGSASDLPFE